MKVTVEEPKTKNEYPRAMVSKSKLIVLFFMPKKGIVLRVGDVPDWEYGEYSEIFDMGKFEPLPAGTKIIIEV